MREREEARESETDLNLPALRLYTHLTTDRGKYKHGKKEGMCQKQEVRVRKYRCSKQRSKEELEHLKLFYFSPAPGSPKLTVLI